MGPPPVDTYFATKGYIGEYEPGETVYTLRAYLPPQPTPRFLPTLRHHDKAATKHDEFTEKDLASMDTKDIKIKSFYFPMEMRCKHVTATDGAWPKECMHGCYVLETSRFGENKCQAGDCEGHVYLGKVKQNEKGKACFGKEKKKMVCID